MQCVCCRCGVANESALSSFCVNVDYGQQFVKHCFCCAQPPRLKCINCNTWRDLNGSETHSPCIDEHLHIFVYSAPWPPFPDHLPAPPQRINSAPSPVVMNELSVNSSLLMPVEDHTVLNTEFTASPPYEPSVEIHSDASEVSDVDVKPRRVRAFRWVALNDIQSWPHCIRCGLTRTKVGWIKHARACGQNPKYNTPMFFIRLHTLGWCRQLVHDAYWNTHTDPEKGKCKVCRASRRANLPLPYMPKPTPRPNEHLLEKNRRRRRSMIKQRRKTMVEEANNTTIII